MVLTRWTTRCQSRIKTASKGRSQTPTRRRSSLGSPTTPKTAAAVARVEAQARRQSPRDTASTVEPEQQIITNAGIDERVPPEQLQPDNRRHLSERTQQETSQAVGTKREREASTPRTREQLLALRYWTLISRTSSAEPAPWSWGLAVRQVPRRTLG
ncbi:unnamed protein product [Phytophthora fragariaefolia]|uniref:Unnamed protein product n=1 Tax=Phytophthora fragariaefolia TaxID=1490495 RepID=A0A9W6TSB2_9STRA|nr:unnamed protein product [Phytophthora fragariaefolia]